MSKILNLLLLLVFITSCSFHKNSKFWNKEKITIEQNTIDKKLPENEKVINLELNANLKINLTENSINNSFINNLDNNNGRINYEGILKNKQKYKFSKIKNFDQYEPKIIFNQSNIIFFDNKGSILNFDNKSNLLWKKNYYLKSEKKINPILFFANNKDFLIVADNISKLYALDINTGELLWSKRNNAPFNSQIKIHKDKFYVVDFENILRSYSIENGEETWSVATKKSLVRSQKKLSIVIKNDKIFFNNSLGLITSVDINTGQLLWQIPTEKSIVYDESFFLKTSELIGNENTLFFSNNKNKFFSLDMESGYVNWQQKINSSLKPTIVGNYLFTVSENGYLFVIEKKTGNIIKINDVFGKFKDKLRKKIYPTGFIVGMNSIYLTTSHGRLLVIDAKSGKNRSILKIDKNKISRPSILNQDMFIVTDNSIIRLN